MRKQEFTALVRHAKAHAGPLTPAEEANQITWTLTGHLKNAQISYLRVATLLARMRDETLFKELKFADMETYADTRLRLSRTSLYRYLRAYDFAFAFHKEWLQPKPKGFIPDLAAVDDLVWIEKDLARTNLDAKTRAALEALRKKGLEGRLHKGEIDPYRRRHHGNTAALRALLSRLRFERKRASQLENVPGETLAGLDAAISALASVLPGRLTQIALTKPGKKPTRAKRAIVKSKARK